MFTSLVKCRKAWSCCRSRQQAFPHGDVVWNRMCRLLGWYNEGSHWHMLFTPKHLPLSRLGIGLKGIGAMQADRLKAWPLFPLYVSSLWFPWSQYKTLHKERAWVHRVWDKEQHLYPFEWLPSPRIAEELSSSAAFLRCTAELTSLRDPST